MNTIPNQSPNFMMQMKKPKDLSNVSDRTVSWVVSYLRNAEGFKYIPNDIVLCFLKPSQKKSILKVEVFNQQSGTFYRDKKDNIVIINRELGKLLSYKTYQRYADQIMKVLNAIRNKEYTAPRWETNPGRYANDTKCFEEQQLIDF